MSNHREIPMVNGFVALVSIEDYEAVARVTWYKGTSGYAVNRNNVNGSKKTLRMHRFVMELHGVSIPDGMEVDHINHDRLDNRFENLRLCNRSLNFANKQYASTNFRGVTVHPSGTKRYQARLHFKGKKYSLGYYETAEEAAAAYNHKAIEIFGEFATLNPI
jgi:hypothetical protein